MPSLTYHGPDDLRWTETPLPSLVSDDSALVRPICVATCDLDDYIVSGDSPFEPPFSLGHEGVAEVVDVGDRVRSVTPGDLVIVPFQISCGTCAPCLQGRTASCATVPIASTYGFGFGPARWGGFLADVVPVPYADHMLAPLPNGIPPEAAAGTSDNISDGFRTVSLLKDRWPGAPVLVVGGAGVGSIGLYAVGSALALGAERVLYVDEDGRRRAIAERLGATLPEIPERLDETFPITVDSSANPRGLELALRSTAADGTCTSTGIYFDGVGTPTFPLLEMYVRNVTFFTGRPHVRGVMDEATAAIAAGFDPTLVTTRVVDWQDAGDALVSHDFVKLLFRRA